MFVVLMSSMLPELSRYLQINMLVQLMYFSWYADNYTIQKLRLIIILPILSTVIYDLTIRILFLQREYNNWFFAKKGNLIICIGYMVQSIIFH